MNAARLAGYSEHYARQSAKWHTDRARGQEERVARVLDCGAEVVEILCQDCGSKHERLKGCGVPLLCLRCRGAVAAKKRAMLLAARDVVLADAGQRGLLRWNRLGGRWTEKLVTLTVPHDRCHTVSARIRLLRTAWEDFLRRLNKHLRAQDAHQSAQFFRCLEWTPGDDGRGHPHIHMWFFGPFLDQELVHGWWRAALESAGCTIFPTLPDIRCLHGGPKDAQEIIKYLTKDIDSAGNKIDPAVYAEVYKAFDGRRVTQSSRGFIKLGGRREGCECGSLLPKSVTVRRKQEPSE